MRIHLDWADDIPGMTYRIWRNGEPLAVTTDNLFTDQQPERGVNNYTVEPVDRRPSGRIGIDLSTGLATSETGDPGTRIVITLRII